MAVGQRTDFRLEFGGEVPNRERLHLDCEPISLDLRQHQDVGEDGEQVASRIVDLAHLRRPVEIVRFAQILNDHLAVTDDLIQRGTNLVAHRSEKRILHSARLQSLVAGQPDLLGPLHGFERYGDMASCGSNEVLVRR